MKTERKTQAIAGCVYELCQSEGNPIEQKDKYCAELKKFDWYCIGIGAIMNKTWSFFWRARLECRMSA